MIFTNFGIAPPSVAIYPSWGNDLINVVENAIGVAWLRLLANHATVVATHSEDKITDKLIEELADLRANNLPEGFSSAFFCMPIRDAKITNIDATSIDQMPDITIHPASTRQHIRNHRHDALFFECKVLDKTRGVNLYQTNGIDRFINCQYAWCMPHAGMIAYVFDKFASLTTAEIRKHLGNAVSSENSIAPVPASLMTPATNSLTINKKVLDVEVTTHARSLLGTNNAISLRHLWLSQ